MLSVQPHQHVADYERAEDIADRNEDSLVQVVAQLFETEDVGFHLLRRDLLVHRESVLARRADGHRREAVVVAGNASGLGNEIGVGPLQQRQTALHGALDVVLAAGLQNGGTRSRLGPGLDQQFHDRRVAVEPGDIEHAESGIAALLVTIDGVDVGTAIDQQLDYIEGQHIGRHRVHQGSAAEPHRRR